MKYSFPHKFSPFLQLFGQPQPQQQAAPLFGQTTATTGTGLFGATAPATSTAGGNLFGQVCEFKTESHEHLCLQPKPAAGGLFGATAAAQPTVTGTGLFGQKPATGTSVSFANGFHDETCSLLQFFGQTQPQQQTTNLLGQGPAQVVAPYVLGSFLRGS